MSQADFKRDLLAHGGINSGMGTIYLAGNIRMLGSRIISPRFDCRKFGGLWKCGHSGVIF